MGDEGLENLLKTRGKTDLSDTVAQKLAQFKVGLLWEALSDLDRATLFAVAAGMIEGRGAGTEVSNRTS